MWLGSRIAVAVVQASGYSFNSTPSLGTSIGHRRRPKKTKKKKKKKNTTIALNAGIIIFIADPPLTVYL